MTPLSDPDAPWSDPALRDRLIGAYATLEAPSPVELVAAVQRVQNTVGYDSFDREMAFQSAVVIFGFTYDDLYDAWLHEVPTDRRFPSSLERGLALSGDV